MLRVWLLGGFRLSVGSTTVDDDRWRLRKAASLVKLLALAPGHRLHREQAMDLLWPDLGRKAASNNLRQALHAARKALDATGTASRYLTSQDESLVLCPKGDLWVDARGLRGGRARRPALAGPGGLPGGPRALRRGTLARGPLRGVGGKQAGGPPASVPRTSG